MGITRKKMLDQLATRGLTAPKSAADVCKWLGEKALAGEIYTVGDVELSTETGAVADAVEKAWNAMEPVNLALSEKSLAESGTTPDAAMEAYRAAKAAGTGAKTPHAAAIHGSGSFSAAKKAYERKIDKGTAVYADADTAEAATACLRLASTGGRAYGQKANDLDILKKANVEFQNTLGGYLVPSDFVAQLLYLTEPQGVARKIANVSRMSRDVQSFPRKTGNQAMTWVGENTTSTPGQQTYDGVNLVAGKLMSSIQVSNELLEDAAINVADDYGNGVREEYDKAIDQAYFLGDGTSTYGGFVGLANALPGAGTAGSGAYSTATAWGSIATSTFLTAMGSVQNINPSRLRFVCSRQFYFQVMLRLDTATSQFRNLIGPATTGGDAQWLGYPVHFCQVMPITTAANKACYFGDFMGGSMIGERRDLTIASSEHIKFLDDAMVFRATARAAINIHGDGKGSTVGPIYAICGS